VNSPKPVFVTGGTGLIGSRVVRRLVASGRPVRCLVRDPTRAAALLGPAVELVAGDLTDAEAVTRGVADADTVIHIGAIYDIGVVNSDRLERTNVGGTHNVIEAAGKAGVRRLVHVSTTVALGPATNGQGDAEAEWAGPFPTVYQHTKVEAHRLARNARAEIPGLIIVCPAFGYGPGDTGPAGQFIDDLVHGRVPGLLTRPAWYSYVHVDDIAEGIVLATDRGHDGAIYVLSGEDATVNDFAIRVARLAGRRPPPLRMPPSVARALGSVLDGLSRVTGKRFTISVESVAISANYRWLHSHERATRDLDWHPRTLDEGLPETVAWYREKGEGEG
jgi:dihydroflavonol-4-reductase